MRSTWTDRPWLIPLGIFLAALVVRVFVLMESSANPSFHAPVIDAARYDALARSLAAGGRLGPEYFWQPIFYPGFLGLVYAVGGSSILLAKILQMLLGCVTCVLTWRLGGRLFGPRVGLAAGIILALYGPLVFFETELLATGWSVFFGVALLLLLMDAREKPRLWRLTLFGLCGALASFCRPTFVPFVLAGVVWLVWNRRRDAETWRPAALELLVVCGGVFLVAGPVLALGYRATSRLSLLPLSSGLNLHLGNNRDYCRAMTVRPGEEWQRLVDRPFAAGRPRRPGASNRYFLGEVGRYVRTEPGSFVLGLGAKSLRLLSSREIPRNVSLYVGRKWSGVLGLLTFRIGDFGFPFGVLLPLALLGLVAGWRRVRGPPILLLTLYPLSLIAVFVTARYRLVLIPLLAVLAAHGGVVLLGWVRGHRVRHLVITASGLIGSVMVTCLPGPFCEEKGHFEAELYLAAGAYHAAHGRTWQAMRLYHRAVRRWPDFFEAHFNLARIYNRQRQTEAAIRHFRRALALRPDKPEAHTGLAVALVDRGQLTEAIAHVAQAARLRPRSPTIHFLLGRLLGRAGRFRQAVVAFRQANRLRPDEPRTLNALAWLLTGTDDQSLANPSEAVRLAEKASRLSGHRDPLILDTLAVACLSAGQTARALRYFRRALALALARRDAQLASAIRRRLRRAERAPPGPSR